MTANKLNCPKTSIDDRERRPETNEKVAVIMCQVNSFVAEKWQFLLLMCKYVLRRKIAQWLFALFIYEYFYLFRL